MLGGSLHFWGVARIYGVWKQGDREENIIQLNWPGKKSGFKQCQMLKWYHRMQRWEAARSTWGEGEGLLLSGRCSLRVEGYQLSVVRETVVLITCINQDHGGLVHEVFLVCHWKQSAFFKEIGEKTKTWKVWSIFVWTSWTLVLLFHSLKQCFKVLWKIQLCCSREIHGNTLTAHMGELLFEYCKNSKQH